MFTCGNSQRLAVPRAGFSADMTALVYWEKHTREICAYCSFLWGRHACWSRARASVGDVETWRRRDVTHKETHTWNGGARSTGYQARTCQSLGRCLSMLLPAARLTRHECVCFRTLYTCEWTNEHLLQNRNEWETQNHNVWKIKSCKWQTLKKQSSASMRLPIHRQLLISYTTSSSSSWKLIRRPLRGLSGAAQYMHVQKQKLTVTC